MRTNTHNPQPHIASRLTDPSSFDAFNVTQTHALKMHHRLCDCMHCRLTDSRLLCMPSICTSMVSSALSRSWLPGSPPSVDLDRPMASISSMKMMHGAFWRAAWYRLCKKCEKLCTVSWS